MHYSIGKDLLKLVDSFQHSPRDSLFKVGYIKGALKFVSLIVRAIRNVTFISDFVQIIYFEYIFYIHFEYHLGNSVTRPSVCLLTDIQFHALYPRVRIFIINSYKCGGWLLHQFWHLMDSYVGQSVATLG